MGCSIIFICTVILRLLLLYSLSLIVASNSFNDDSSCPSVDDGPPSPVMTPNNIFLLAGQSNMAGRGGSINYAKKLDCTKIPPQCHSDRILQLTHDSDNWETTKEFIHRVIDCLEKPRKAWGIGPGMSFANSLLANDSSNIGVIGLVPCAVGGSNLSNWSRGGYYFDRMVQRAKNATTGIGGQIRALLWYQGESDSFKINVTLAYKEKLNEFFTGVRSELQLPIIQVAIASGGHFKPQIKEAQLNNTFSSVVTVDADGLPLKTGRR